jgi:hypothetical protein
MSFPENESSNAPRVKVRDTLSTHWQHNENRFKIMTPSLRLATLLAWLLMTTYVLAQSVPKIDEKSQAAVDQLQAIVVEIKKCPKAVYYESKDKKGPFAGMRIYQGPTLNVEWDVGESKSIRSPYQGYLEVHLAQQFWLPTDVLTKYSDKLPPDYTKMFLGPQPALAYKYEFDVGPSGLELYRSSSRTSDETEWKDYKPTSGRCWDEAVKKGVSDTRDKQQ